MGAAPKRERRTIMSEQPQRVAANLLPPGPYAYRRDSDGCDDTFDITDARGTHLTSVPFWDDPETDHAARAESIARLFAAAPTMLAALQSFEIAWRRWAEDIRRFPGLAEKTEMLRIYDAARAAIAEANAA
jgi:hypothetical protein